MLARLPPRYRPPRRQSPLPRRRSCLQNGTVLTPEQVLRIWERRWGRRWPLTPALRQQFLAHPALQVLTKYSTREVDSVVSHHRRLAEAAARIEKERPPLDPSGGAAPGNPPPRKPRPSGARDERSRFSHGHFPHRPHDADLHKKIGPTMKYSDDT
jgi:hypothetical protein